MNAHAHFANLARYNVWATTRLLDAVSKVGDKGYRRDVGLFFKSIHGTLNHLLVGEHLLWYRRFADAASPIVALDMEAEIDREGLAKALKAGAAKWAPLIASWPVERFDTTLEYTTMKGVPVSLPFAPTLAHVFNHGTHHRGQITAALTGLGLPCPELDFAYLLHEESILKKTNP